MGLVRHVQALVLWKGLLQPTGDLLARQSSCSFFGQPALQRLVFGPTWRPLAAGAISQARSVCQLSLVGVPPPFTRPRVRIVDAGATKFPAACSAWT